MRDVVRVVRGVIRLLLGRWRSVRELECWVGAIVLADPAANRDLSVELVTRPPGTLLRCGNGRPLLGLLIPTCRSRIVHAHHLLLIILSECCHKARETSTESTARSGAHGCTRAVSVHDLGVER